LYSINDLFLIIAGCMAVVVVVMRFNLISFSKFTSYCPFCQIFLYTSHSGVGSRWLVAI